MGVSLKTEKRRSQQTSLVCHCPVFSFRPRVRRTNDVRWRAEGLPGMTTEDLHGYERRSAPPALLPLICMVSPGHSSFSVLRETPVTFSCGHFKKLKHYPPFRSMVMQEIPQTTILSPICHQAIMDASLLNSIASILSTSLIQSPSAEA